MNAPPSGAVLEVKLLPKKYTGLFKILFNSIAPA
jgi:hypothetical protein